jgi:hypothetical protein
VPDPRQARPNRKLGGLANKGQKTRAKTDDPNRRRAQITLQDVDPAPDFEAATVDFGSAKTVKERLAQLGAKGGRRARNS